MIFKNLGIPTQLQKWNVKVACVTFIYTCPPLRVPSHAFCDNHLTQMITNTLLLFPPTLAFFFYSFAIDVSISTYFTIYFCMTWNSVLMVSSAL